MIDYANMEDKQKILAEWRHLLGRGITAQKLLVLVNPFAGTKKGASVYEKFAKKVSQLCKVKDMEISSRSCGKYWITGLGRGKFQGLSNPSSFEHKWMDMCISI